MKIHSLLVIVLFVSLYPLKASTFIDWIGSYSDDSLPWKIVIHPDKPPQFGYNHKGGIETAVSPSAWRPRKGWFVFVENDSRLWAFDGVDELLLTEVSADGGVLYDLESLSIMPPLQVMERLPEPIRKDVIAKVKKTEPGAAINP